MSWIELGTKAKTKNSRQSVHVYLITNLTHNEPKLANLSHSTVAVRNLNPIFDISVIT